MKLFIITLTSFLSTSAFAVGLVETMGAVAIQQELQKQSAQETSTQLKQVRKNIKKNEEASENKQRQLEQLMDDLPTE